MKEDTLKLVSHNTNDHKRLSAVTHQQMRQPRENGYIFRNMQLTKT